MKRGGGALLLLFAGSLAAQPRLDYPLAPKTRWTYHLRQEGIGGARDTTVVAEVAGVDRFSGREYARVENRRDGKLWLVEWYRLTPAGLMVGKSIDYDEGPDEIVIEPEQRRIAASLRPKDFWYWQAKNPPARFRYDVIGPDEVQVAAGRFSAVRLTTKGTLTAPVGVIEVRQETWFVPAVGIARQDTNMTLKGRLLSHNVLTLDKFEKH